MNKIKFKMNFWIHSHYETHEPLQLSLFRISGKDIPMAVIYYLENEGSYNEIDALMDYKLKPETEYTADVTMGDDYDPIYNDGGFFIESLENIQEIMHIGEDV